MCVGLGAAFTEGFLAFFLTGSWRRVNLRLVRVYFQRVRVCRVIVEPDAAELTASRVDVCDCRLIERRCGHRIDLCFKLDDHGREKPPPFDAVAMSEEMHRRGLVRMRVETLGRRVEHCHCCPCCCQALRVARVLGPGYVLPAESVSRSGDTCRGCGRCVEACPVGARTAGATDEDRCLGCGLCAQVCTARVLRMRPPRSALRARADRGRERRLRKNRALAHLLGFLMMGYVLCARWLYGRGTRVESPE